MRFEDWDVLLFSGPNSETGHIPLREFKTQCHALEDVSLSMVNVSRSHSVGPLMTCFMPALNHGAPFQISVHSWAPKHFVYAASEGTSATQIWQVKVAVDGIDCCIEHYPQDVAWPKVLTVANMLPADAEGNVRPLRFPKFYKSVMSQQHWDANDFQGRIKVEISEGYLRSDHVFVKLMNHGIFNFQPAPMDVLQRAGIAWPNAMIFKNPIKSDAALPFGQGPAFAHRPEHQHQRNMSASSMHSVQSSPSYYGYGPPATPSSYAQSLVAPNSHANSSRSTSAYSTIPYSALPPPAAAAAAAARSPAYPTNAALQGHVSMRLPSDQFNQLLTAIGSPRGTSSSMPPPPVPQHAITPPQITGTEALGGDNRRLANNSDISMHPDYESYPDCTTEDDEGHIVHDPPAQAVKGRKEGPAETHNRDFFSNVLNPASSDSSGALTQPSSSPQKKASITSSSPANGLAKKRTRSLTKTAVGTDGSPEKVDKDTEKPARKVRRQVTAGAD